MKTLLYKKHTSELAKQLCGSSRFRRRLRGVGSACGESGGGGGIFPMPCPSNDGGPDFGWGDCVCWWCWTIGDAVSADGVMVTTAAALAVAGCVRVWQLSIGDRATGERHADGIVAAIADGTVPTAPVDIGGTASCCFDAVDDVIVTDNDDANGDRADVFMSSE